MDYATARRAFSERRNHLFTLGVALVFGACSGSGGCGGCMTTIPGGFPADQRTNNAVQVRVTESGLDVIEQDPQALALSLIGQDELTFAIPPDCVGDQRVCCSGGTPDLDCGPILLDLEPQAGDSARLRQTARSRWGQDRSGS